MVLVALNAPHSARIKYLYSVLGKEARVKSAKTRRPKINIKPEAIVVERLVNKARGPRIPSAKKKPKKKVDEEIDLLIDKAKQSRISAKQKLKEDNKDTKEVEEPAAAKEGEEEDKKEEEIEEETPGFPLPEEEVEFIYLNTHYSEQAIRDWHRLEHVMVILSNFSLSL